MAAEGAVLREHLQAQAGGTTPSKDCEVIDDVAASGTKSQVSELSRDVVRPRISHHVVRPSTRLMSRRESDGTKLTANSAQAA